MANALKTYLRTYRRLWGLTQDELAYLLGLESSTSVSRFEREERDPSFSVAVASQIIFGPPPAEFFPGPYSEIEQAVCVARAIYMNGFRGVRPRRHEQSSIF
jgi:transcriptional regulator with XRE-family HTH domain